jgi:hypothetical protein
MRVEAQLAHDRERHSQEGEAARLGDHGIGQVRASCAEHLGVRWQKSVARRLAVETPGVRRRWRCGK